jgi:hypothetical protein
MGRDLLDVVISYGLGSNKEERTQWVASQSQQQLGKHVIVYIYRHALGSPPFHLILLVFSISSVFDGGRAGGDAVAGSQEDGTIAVPAGVRVLREQPGEEGGVPGRSHPAGTPTGICSICFLS